MCGVIVVSVHYGNELLVLAAARISKLHSLGLERWHLNKARTAFEVLEWQWHRRSPMTFWGTAELADGAVL